MLLGVVEEKVYYRYLGQRHLRECRGDVTRLIWALRGERDEEGKGREGSQLEQPGGQRYKMSG